MWNKGGSGLQRHGGDPTLLLLCPCAALARWEASTCGSPSTVLVLRIMSPMESRIETGTQCWLNVAVWLPKLVVSAQEGVCCLFLSSVGRNSLGKPLLAVSIRSPFAKPFYCNDAISLNVLHYSPLCHSQGVWLKSVESSLGLYWLWYSGSAP